MNKKTAMLYFFSIPYVLPVKNVNTLNWQRIVYILYVESIRILKK